MYPFQTGKKFPSLSDSKKAIANDACMLKSPLSYVPILNMLTKGSREINNNKMGSGKLLLNIFLYEKIKISREKTAKLLTNTIFIGSWIIIAIICESYEVNTCFYSPAQLQRLRKQKI